MSGNCHYNWSKSKESRRVSGRIRLSIVRKIDVECSITSRRILERARKRFRNWGVFRKTSLCGDLIWTIGFHWVRASVTHTFNKCFMRHSRWTIIISTSFTIIMSRIPNLTANNQTKSFLNVFKVNEKVSCIQMLPVDLNYWVYYMHAHRQVGSSTTMWRAAACPNRETNPVHSLFCLMIDVPFSALTMRYAVFAEASIPICSSASLAKSIRN